MKQPTPELLADLKAYNMDPIYHWVGFVITWLFISVIIVAAIGLMATSLWYLFYRKVWMNDWVAFNIRRVTIPTDKLREGYASFKMNAYWRRYTAKYRLRNIKRLNP